MFNIWNHIHWTLISAHRNYCSRWSSH